MTDVHAPTDTSFTATAEQEELRRSVRAFLTAKVDEAAVRRAIGTAEGHDLGVWRQMADQLGLHGLAVDEPYGGHGFTFADLAVALEEMGRVLLPGPFFASAVLAAQVLIHADDGDARSSYLPGIASGDSVATCAFTGPSGRWDESGIDVEAVESGSDTWRLDGVATYVPNGMEADLMLVLARTDGAVSLFAVEFDDDGLAPGVDRRTLSTLDPTRRQARIDFRGARARPIGRPGASWPTVRSALTAATAGLAAEQVGGAARCLELSVEYAKVRRQFGRPIGSFQAIRHRCADVMLDVECARGVAQYAAHQVTVGSPTADAAVSLAKAYSSDVFSRAAAASIQIHGGIGFTWEHPAHLYYKRARSSGLLLGDAAHHRARLATHVDI
ncbi:acyl-CoA dehydrogenase [Mycolicibacterium sp. 018/SC-01/001]|uniref:acyl-CoA dehydrogenase family protein n=1 Tax=Mycolicibacterium sp. 018/SC-01/001 TaxID=2592069 RepID=UPI00117C8F9D|nr:acyl-CoA dehydrogenase family protein [Mycolicibacterium sp. 018/SC-01/001]TRW79639.1 acyl-CoA dehydrogenase [Mycolicibacterium sp. 018/SC-01/001]